MGFKILVRKSQRHYTGQGQAPHLSYEGDASAYVLASFLWIRGGCSALVKTSETFSVELKLQTERM